ncbi:restriction endonuclease subunit S [Nonomuraea sp. CA-218870]|uniref:restriction endonuclease subunit S n=1 Tax=Nonomuraea sp. CA-218870 TaxID=3239998 RepID=UPI003D89C47E
MTDLPSGWERVSVADIADVQGGIQKQAKRRPVKNKYPFLRVANVGRGKLNLKDVHEIELFEGEIERFRLRPGDLLVVEGNGSPKEIGRAAMWHGEIGDCVHQNHLIRVRPTSAVLPKYLELAWSSPDIVWQLRRTASSTSGLFTLSTSKIKLIQVSIPPREEQQRIVDILESQLSRCGAAVSLLLGIMKRIDALRDRVMEAASLGRLLEVNSESFAAPPAPAGVLDGDLPRLPNDWRWLRLGDIAEVVGGVTKDSKKQSDPNLPEVPYLRVANVQRARLNLSSISYIRVSAAKADQLMLRRGDVLLNEGGDRDKLGRGWIWEDQIPGCIHQNHVFRARLLDKILHPKLLAWHANGFGRTWFERNGKQSVNLASIGLSKIKMFPVPIPPPALQEKLVAEAERHLSILDDAEAAVRRALLQADHLRRSLLSEACSGRLTSQASEDEPASESLYRAQVKRATKHDSKAGKIKKSSVVRRSTVPNTVVSSIDDVEPTIMKGTPVQETLL